MSYTIIITPQMLAILGGIAGLLLTVFGWVARLFWNQRERETAERNARMDREAKERNERMDRERAEVIALIKQTDKRFEERFEKHEARSEERFEKHEARSEERFEKHEARSEKRFEKQEARSEKRSEKQEAKDKERHGEIRAELRDLNKRVGRLEGRAGINDSSAGAPGQGSLRQSGGPASAPPSEPDPAPVADDFDQSMVPLAGGRAETQPAAGLAHQAAPDPPQSGETDPEPQPEDSPDAAR